jgi:uncharacterized protein
MQAPNISTEPNIARQQAGTYLKFYVHERRKHGGSLLYEWLLETAKRMGIHGGTAFRAAAGFGHHGVLHEQRFFEIPADLPIEVGFVVSDAEAQALIALIEQEDAPVFFVKVPVEYGILNLDKEFAAPGRR